MAGLEGQNENDVSDSMRIMLAIQDMAFVIRETNQHNHKPHQETQDDQIMRIQGEFRKTRPPVFKSDPNPMAAKEWLRQIWRKMNEQRVPGNLKVTIAFTYLEGHAYHWWESVLAMPDVEITTWVAFETIFLEKYFPETMKTMKVHEFTNLYQGDMTVGQYQAKFEELMRFAPYMILNESAKAKKFEEGLRLEVKEKVELFKLKKYADVVDAVMAEQRILGSKRDITEGIVPSYNHIRYLLFHNHNHSLVHHNNNFKLHKHSTVLRTRPHIKIHRISLEVLLIKRHNVRGDNLHNKGLGHQEQQGDLNNSLKDELIAHMANKDLDYPKLELIPIVKNFNDVFLEELSGLPPEHEVEFSIDIYLGTSHISIPPHQMAPAELKEVETQLQELERKGFICPSTSP
ncbi:unnamed protein product [Prunus armeniaca]|uniref:Retrotransposon gag domain-containing protein n=1 Tax=Prunus armeniaca TaxID=36596 RepID=A0A6J5UY37_PRUAR|nr:unnamed protein product [Prunus armeniaca]